VSVLPNQPNDEPDQLVAHRRPGLSLVAFSIAATCVWLLPDAIAAACQW
jgi:hypothetical protein